MPAVLQHIKKIINKLEIHMLSWREYLAVFAFVFSVCVCKIAMTESSCVL